MPDELRSPIKHHLVLHRIDPEQGVRRFYSLMIERGLFGAIRLVRNWGRIGTSGRELVEVFASEADAGQALEVVAAAKRRREYRVHIGAVFRALRDFTLGLTDAHVLADFLFDAR